MSELTKTSFESLYSKWVNNNGSRSPSIQYALRWMFDRLSVQREKEPVTEPKDFQAWFTSMLYRCDSCFERDVLRANKPNLLRSWQNESQETPPAASLRDRLKNKINQIRSLTFDQHGSRHPIVTLTDELMALLAENDDDATAWHRDGGQ
jgi:hypothetical protein